MLNGGDPREKWGLQEKMKEAAVLAGLVILILVVMVWAAWSCWWREPYCDKYLPDVDAYEACLEDQSQVPWGP